MPEATQFQTFVSAPTHARFAALPYGERRTMVEFALNRFPRYARFIALADTETEDPRTYVLFVLADEKDGTPIEYGTALVTFDREGARLGHTVRASRLCVLENTRYGLHTLSDGAQDLAARVNHDDF